MTLLSHPNKTFPIFSCKVNKTRKARYNMESSVTFSRSFQSTSIDMPSIDEKPEKGIPNPCTVQVNKYTMGPELSAEATTL